MCKPPGCAMFSMSIPNFSAMNPRTEKTTNPAIKLVQLFSTHSQMLYLQDNVTYRSLVFIQLNKGIHANVIPISWVLTYSSWFCNCCNFQEQLSYLLLNCRRRKSESLHQSRPMWHSNKAEVSTFCSCNQSGFHHIVCVLSHYEQNDYLWVCEAWRLWIKVILYTSQCTRQG